ncbi:MAG: TonB family protein [Bacteroidales bacterium]|nr:TonB family protein [Bacteroidales bacterium]
MMRKLLFLTLFFVPAMAMAQYAALPGADMYESDRMYSMRQNVSYFASAALEGRAAGSQGEADAAAYLTELFGDAGVDVLSSDQGDIFGMKLDNGDTLRSRNVIGFIPGYDHNLKDHYIVIGARLDNLGTYTVNDNGELLTRTYFGANGNASGLAMLAELAQMLSSDRVLLRRSVILAGFGASLKSQAGSWYFLNRSFADSPNIDAMINLDMLGTGSRGFYAFTGANNDLNILIGTLSGTLQPVHPKLVSMEPCASDHRSFYGSRIPSVMFTTGMYPEYNTYRDTPSVLEYDMMEKELEYIYNFTVSLCNGIKPSFVNETADQKASDDAVPFYACDVRPSFLGSTSPDGFLQKWVYTYLRYPAEAADSGIQGRVLVGFTVDEKGKVGDVKVLRSVDPLLDAEAVRVVSASPDWKPGRVKGQKVKSSVSVYVEFRLKKNH